MMGVNASGLRQTIDRYNGFANRGTDDDFGKTGPFRSVTTAPFYGLKASLIRHTQRNGARVNTKSQVIESIQITDSHAAPPVSIDSEKVIPHLYAAGELGNTMGWRRAHGSLGNYTIFARIAGENAAKERPID